MPGRLPKLPRRRGARRAAVLLGVVIALGGAAGLTTTALGGVGDIGEVPEVAGVLTAHGGAVENYLLIGSDSRENVDPSDPDWGAIGGTDDVSGRRSDTVMVLRYDTANGGLALLSLPRDLWVEIPGYRADRINSAYGRGPDVLVETVQSSLGIPVHHYLEVDFIGFKDIVDAIGGVEVCIDTPVRDTQSGLDLPQAGCHRLGGIQALAYTRSRYYERLVDGDWVRDRTADLGRTERQRLFVQATFAALSARVAANPFRGGAVLDAVTASLMAEPGFDVVTLAARVRPVAGGNIDSYALPVRNDNIDGKSVLRLTEGADAVLAYFRGEGPPPAP